MGFMQKVISKITGASAQEKTPTHGGWNTMEGFFPSFFGSDWYQRGFTPGHDHRHNPDVAAAISLYKRALMSVPTKHIVRQDNGAGIELNLDSALSQVVNRPNQYMSWAECVGVIIDGLLTRGEFACFVTEDDLLGDELERRTTIHPIHNFQMISAQDGSIFYQVDFHDAHKYLGDSWADWTDVEGKMYIPQRHIVHGRFEVDPRNPLKALPPLHAFANSIGLGSVLRQGQEAFHINKGQPSGIISTDQTLTAEQASRLRERWNEMSQKMRQGETPILSNGLRWQSTSVSANEGQVIQLLGFTTKDIAKAFGIPPILLGVNEGMTYGNLEQLLYGWRTTGLLSICQIIEQAFEYTFKLPKNEELVFDIGDLARAEALHQADTLTRLVLNGIIKPNEARARLELAPIPGVADQLVSQMQVQPMQQNSDLALRSADRADELARAQAESSKQAVDRPHKTEDREAKVDPVDRMNELIAARESEQKKQAEDNIDLEALTLMIKGVLK